MSSARGKKQPKKYDGWKEPKIAISFLNNSHIYYGAVWGMIVAFLLFAKIEGLVLTHESPERSNAGSRGAGVLPIAPVGLINLFKKKSSFITAMILILRAAFLLIIRPDVPSAWKPLWLKLR